VPSAVVTLVGGPRGGEGIQQHFKQKGRNTMMAMQIHLHDQTLRRLQHAAQTTGFPEENLIQRAVLYYLDALQKQVELADEFQTWDVLSDEALTTFEASL
jgi:hypothetical protein